MKKNLMVNLVVFFFVLSFFTSALAQEDKISSHLQKPSIKASGEECARGYIVDIFAPHSGGAGSEGNWYEFTVQINNVPTWTSSAKPYFHDSTNISLRTDLGRILYSQAVNAMNMGYQVILRSEGGCNRVGFSSIEMWK